MRTTQQFLDAIAKHPGDAMIRLQFADWLEERGHPLCHEWRGMMRLVPIRKNYYAGNSSGDGLGYGSGYHYGTDSGDGAGNGRWYGINGGDGCSYRLEYARGGGENFGYSHGFGDGHSVGDNWEHTY